MWTSFANNCSETRKIPLKRDATGNLQRNDNGEYADKRAQQVNDALVTGELLQAIGRARLNLYPNRVFSVEFTIHRRGFKPKRDNAI